VVWTPQICFCIFCTPRAIITFSILTLLGLLSSLPLSVPLISAMISLIRDMRLSRCTYKTTLPSNNRLFFFYSFPFLPSSFLASQPLRPPPTTTLHAQPTCVYGTLSRSSRPPLAGFSRLRFQLRASWRSLSATRRHSTLNLTHFHPQRLATCRKRPNRHQPDVRHVPALLFLLKLRLLAPQCIISLSPRRICTPSPRRREICRSSTTMLLDPRLQFIEIESARTAINNAC
jgi:hypothetical protein